MTPDQALQAAQDLRNQAETYATAADNARKRASLLSAWAGVMQAAIEAGMTDLMPADLITSLAPAPLTPEPSVLPPALAP